MQPEANPIFVTSKARLRRELTDIIKPLVRAAVEEIRPADAEPKAFLTNDEACAYLGLARPTLAKYRANGTLPFSKLGGSVFYRREDVEAILDARRVTTPASGDAAD